MTAWDIKTGIVGICIMASFFLAPLAAYAGDEKGEGKHGVESVEPAKPSIGELKLQAENLRLQYENHILKAGQAKQDYQAVQAEIKKQEGLKKAEKKDKK